MLSLFIERQPMFHMGERQHVSTAGSLMPREAALHSAPLREPFLPRPPDDARSALPILALAYVLRGKRCARTPCPPPCRITMRRGVVAQSSLTLAPPAVKGAYFSLSTVNLNRAKGRFSLRAETGEVKFSGRAHKPVPLPSAAGFRAARPLRSAGWSRSEAPRTG